MVKTRTKYVCQQCGSHYPMAYGRCPNCNAWGSLVETVEAVGPASSGNGRGGGPRLGRPAPRPLAQVDSSGWARVHVPTTEFGRVLGGGIVPGSLVLVGGDPGIGKSTLLLQICIEMAATGAVLYISGEESAEQVKMRADRIGPIPDDLYILAETDLETIVAAIEEMQPTLVIVDSIQTMALEELSSAAGSVAQVRDCTARLMRLAKSSHIAIFIVGHVTKEGTIAGPRVLEHIVDTVLYLEGDRFHAYRLLRSVKNRYGSTNEVGVFEMRDAGLLAVENPSAAFLAERGEANPGSAIVVTLEGSRPLLVELQALVSQTGFSLPRRTSTGIDLNRLYILLAVLSKRVGLPMANNDVYCNVVGGLRIGEPAADLGVTLAVVSSFADVPLPSDMVAFGEVGLSGEVRSVSQVAVRVGEAAKLGFTRCLLPAANLRGLNAPPGMTLTGVSTLQEALRAVMPTGEIKKSRERDRSGPRAPQPNRPTPPRQDDPDSDEPADLGDLPWEDE